MKILYIEPYYDGSHKQWIDSYSKYSDHSIDIISLKASKWKWRMHGGAITLAKEYDSLTEEYDLLLCSDFLNLPVFMSISKKKFDKTPIVMYFHENQVSYPWSPKDNDIKLNRDFHYFYINQTSSLASNWNLFNSEYHLNSYLDGLKEYLCKMPDNKNIETIDQIRDKSTVLYLGCDLKKFNENKIKNEINTKPLILWNHRWEFDKNPDLFFKTLIKLKKNGYKFSLAILGESYSDYPEIFDDIKKDLSEELVHIGFCKSFNEYKSWLWRSDILPVTSNQDFFGVSIMEAVYCGAYPILPMRLSYPELFDSQNNNELFYRTDAELYQKLKIAIQNYKDLRSYSQFSIKFDWSNMVKKYDTLFMSSNF